MAQVSATVALRPAWQRVLDYLREHPGEHFSRFDDEQLQEAFPHLSPRTIRWRLWYLARHGYISKERVGRNVFYFYQPAPRPRNAGGEVPGKFTFTVLVERDEDGFIVASCPVLPGCHTQGRTREEALTNIREAIRGYIASMRQHGEEIPQEEVAQVEVSV